VTSSAVPVAAAVLDIEGTTSSITSVRDRLFPYARARIADWMRRPDAEVAAIARDTRAAAGAPGADLDDVIAILTRWADDDVKATPLKTLQGLIWAAGFAAGDLTGHVYDDVPAALARWHAAGIELYVYSSGSVQAQRDWFAHTDHGDLSGQFKGWFDTACPGPKTAVESYRAIATAVGARPAELVFLSDSKTELDAAAAAGLVTIGVRRAEDGSPDVGDHRAFADLASVPLQHT
jgi:enolase-phosphatase E1